MKILSNMLLTSMLVFTLTVKYHTKDNTYKYHAVVNYETTEQCNTKLVEFQRYLYAHKDNIMTDSLNCTEHSAKKAPAQFKVETGTMS